MALFEIGAATPTLNLGLALLATPVLAEWAQIRKQSEQAYTWIAAAGISFLLATSFTASQALGQFAGAATASGALLFDAVGFVLVLVGALMALYESVSEQ